ncbi:MAG TPA: carbonic anhydrase [Candidatus Binataceae bacterium]|nr:carbonic anhydrase [Candidatus Binataceae bacterium]
MRTICAIGLMHAMQLRFAVMMAAFWIFATAQASTVSAAAGAGAPAMSPAQALAHLMAGNQRYQHDVNSHPHLHAKRRSELVGGQAPFAVILSCSDSRVPPELIFDQGLGGLFVVRLAGNTVTRAGLESIDYAVAHLGTNLIMVLGHDSCGAVKGALTECVSKPAAELPEIFANICPAVDQARKAGGGKLESSAIDLNVIGQVRILERSPLFKKGLADGSLKIVGARYNLESGKVEIINSGD